MLFRNVSSQQLHILRSKKYIHMVTQCLQNSQSWWSDFKSKGMKKQRLRLNNFSKNADSMKRLDRWETNIYNANCLLWGGSVFCFLGREKACFNCLFEDSSSAGLVQTWLILAADSFQFSRKGDQPDPPLLSCVTDSLFWTEKGAVRLLHCSSLFSWVIQSHSLAERGNSVKFTLKHVTTHLILHRYSNAHFEIRNSA